jgi:hypothetical protein
MLMMTGFVPVVGFVFFVTGLILFRVHGLVNRKSPIAIWRIRIGGFLLFVGAIVTVLGKIL